MRRHLWRVLLFTMAISIAGWPSSDLFAQDPTPEGIRLREASYDGIWVGTIKCLYDPGLWPDDECDIGLTLDIDGKSISVQQVVRSKAGEATTSTINDGKFAFIRLASNAVAISIDTGKDEDGT